MFVLAVVGFVVTRLSRKVVVTFTGMLRSEFWPSASPLFVVGLRRCRRPSSLSSSFSLFPWHSFEICGAVTARLDRCVDCHRKSKVRVPAVPVVALPPRCSSPSPRVRRLFLLSSPSSVVVVALRLSKGAAVVAVGFVGGVLVVASGISLVFRCRRCSSARSVIVVVGSRSRCSW